MFYFKNVTFKSLNVLQINKTVKDICGGTYAGPYIFPRWLASRPPYTPNYPNLAL